ncbi:unnamed protein product [Merluccius merluccius]
MSALSSPPRCRCRQQQQQQPVRTGSSLLGDSWASRETLPVLSPAPRRGQQQVPLGVPFPLPLLPPGHAPPAADWPAGSRWGATPTNPQNRSRRSFLNEWRIIGDASPKYGCLRIHAMGVVIWQHVVSHTDHLVSAAAPLVPALLPLRAQQTTTNSHTYQCLLEIQPSVIHNSSIHSSLFGFASPLLI